LNLTNYVSLDPTVRLTEATGLLRYMSSHTAQWQF